jgi:hypothetical protein
VGARLVVDTGVEEDHERRVGEQVDEPAPIGFTRRPQDEPLGFDPSDPHLRIMLGRAWRPRVGFVVDPPTDLTARRPRALA